MSETTELTVLVRKCWNCDHLAVPLEGENTDCSDCRVGEYREAVATTEHEVLAETEIINEWADAAASPEQNDFLPKLKDYQVE